MHFISMDIELENTVNYMNCKIRHNINKINCFIIFFLFILFFVQFINFFNIIISTLL